MKIFAVLVVCFQAFLIQDVLSQYPGKYGPANAVAPGLGAAPFLPGLAPGYGYPGNQNGVPGFDLDAYGGTGEGNVVVGGELPVAGTTAVAGQVPIMGAVTFGGDVLAGGMVTITGNCACGCGAPYLY